MGIEVCPAKYRIGDPGNQNIAIFATTNRTTASLAQPKGQYSLVYLSYARPNDNN
jgi:hypothetical protein